MGHATVPMSQCRNASEHLDKLKFERRISGHGGQRSQSAGRFPDLPQGQLFAFDSFSIFDSAFPGQSGTRLRLICG